MLVQILGWKEFARSEYSRLTSATRIFIIAQLFTIPGLQSIPESRDFSIPWRIKRKKPRARRNGRTKDRFIVVISARTSRSNICIRPRRGTATRRFIGRLVKPSLRPNFVIHVPPSFPYEYQGSTERVSHDCLLIRATWRIDRSSWS